MTWKLPFQLVKQCVGTITLDQSDDQFDLNCNEVSGPFLTGRILGGSVWNMLWTNDPLPHPGQKKAPLLWPLPPPSPRSPALALHPLEQWVSNAVTTWELT